ILPMILTVYLSDSQQMLTEVPITPETTCKDVVEFCKEAGEGGCHLTDVWKGNERVIPFDHLMYEHLQEWGPRRMEVGNPCVELTLSELQEMATRQQQQIETQQQMLVAKEQRLRYLQQQDHRQGQTVSEAGKLQRLMERVESQEAKLKKIRAMRGQVDYSKLINGNLSAEIQHVSGQFQEKQAELQSAVVKVDQLNQQLEDLRRGRLNGLQPLGGPLTGTAALELRKLYQELQVRNKLNTEHSGRLQQNKELLNKRNTEVTMMDKRIGDLRERLHKKKTELNRINGPPSPQPTPSSSGRVAAVCPYIQVPVPGRQEVGYALPPDPVKPPFVPGTGTISHGHSKSANEAVWPTLSKSVSLMQPSDWRNTSPDQVRSLLHLPLLHLDFSKLPGGSVSKPLPIYGTYPAPTGHPSIVCSTSSLTRSAPATLAWQRSAPEPPGYSSQQIQQRISVPPSPTPQSGLGEGESHDPLPAVAVRPYVPDRSSSRPQSPRKGPATMNSSSIYHMYLQQPAAAKSYPAGGRSAVKAVYGKPVLPSSTSPSPVPFQHGALSPGGESGEDMVDREGDTTEGRLLPSPSVENIPRPLSPTKLTPVAHSPLRYQSDADLEVLRRRLTNAPRPLKKRSSITEPEGPTGPNIQKLLYQRFNTLAGGMEGSNSTPFYQPVFMGGVLGCPDMDNINTSNGNLIGTASLVVTAADGTNSNHRLSSSMSPSSDSNERRTLPTSETTPHMPTSQPSLEDNNNQPGTNSTPRPIPIPEASSPQPKETSPRTVTPPALVTPLSLSQQIKRTNLKKPESERTGHGLRVKFNPLALLLDASLEGEFDLVQRIIYEVENPSTANDEGITPLHNAVCAGRHHIVKFLLDFGVNVNAADSDGWTPLHCAASCNSVHLCKLLVESGAAIFATTISDVETAADKCEEMEDGYTQCSQFLFGLQEKLGVMNKGSVYALWDYEAQSSDELSFHEGDAITTLSRSDHAETEWWWARLHDKEGYVPRNLLGLYPRIKPRQRSLA
uniref:Protein phosphatase 1, regulatory subunit 13Ba n=1 Tax=Oncorhynchus mykiss TaxID=8022 RepID=A0A8C7QEU5_ONCMY